MTLVVKIIYFLVTLHLFSVEAFEPITTASFGLAIGAATFGFDFLKEQTYCRFKECCDERYIPGDVNLLAGKLMNTLFGQHIVIKQLIPAIEAHFSKQKSRKPLVITFHGTTGTGKNYVSDLIASSLYTNGLKSKYVHKYLGRADFPLATQAEAYKQRIDREVRDGIAECQRSLFIFDEVDKMPPGVFESLASLLEYSNKIGTNDNTQAIFLFLSNTAGVHISDRLGELIKGGTERENTKLSDFEQTLQIAAYNLEGGMQKTSLIEGHLIDHYLPFLPLEKKHVYKCIEAEFSRWHHVAEPNIIESIIQDVVTYDRNYGLFATAGCKNIEKKVAVLVKSHVPGVKSDNLGSNL